MPAFDPVKIFVTAEQFRYASKWLAQARGMGCQADVGIPAVTCAAMALELYLKCLIAMEGTKNPNIHDLRDLFEKLSPSLQASVRSHFDAHSDAVKEFLIKDGSQASEVTFDFVLDWSREAFVRARYVFDDGQPQAIWWADCITECARRVILDAHPDWWGLRMASPEVFVASPIP